MRNSITGIQNRRALGFAALAAVALLWAGCSQQQAAADKAGTENMAAGAKTQTMPTGTDLVAALQSTIDTGKNHAGDKVALRTLQDVRVNEMTVVPAGATINGEVTHVDGAGRIAGGAELTLRFTELVMPDGKSYAISATPLRLEGKGDAKKSAVEIGGGAVAGGILGAVIGGKGAIGKGAVAGAVVGTGVAIATKGHQIVLPAGQQIKVTLDGPVTVTKSTT